MTQFSSKYWMNWPRWPWAQRTAEARNRIDGFKLRSEAKQFLYPDRWLDERGDKMWAEVGILWADQRTQA